MDERRRFGRCEVTESGYIDMDEGRCEVRVLDVSVGGMRVAADVPINKDTVIRGAFRILPNVGPFLLEVKFSGVFLKITLMRPG